MTQGGDLVNLQDILKLLRSYEVFGSIGQIDIKGIKYDSRCVEPGDLFICILGFKTDGHLYAEKAVAQGAIAVLVERYIEGLDVPQIKVKDTRDAMAIVAACFYGYPSKKLGLIGVTGTNGKTTTTYLIKYILEKKHKVGLVGTIGNMIGDKSLPSTRTTPEAVELQEIFCQMLKEDVAYGVMEVSSHALTLKRVEGSSFDVGVYSNMSLDHLDFHKTFEAYREAKGKLFEMIGKDKKDRPQYAVINRDDQNYEYFKSKCQVPVYTYGIDRDCDFRAKNVQVKDQGVSYDLEYPVASKAGDRLVGSQKLEVVSWKESLTTDLTTDDRGLTIDNDRQPTTATISMNLKITGLFNVYNSLAAFAVGYLEGIPTEVIKESLEVAGVPGRFEKVDLNQDFTVIVDYAHTPDSLENVLTSAKKFVKGQIITVFGCGGDRDRTKRSLMGEAVAKYSNYSIVTSDNPRSEDPEAIIRDILPGLDKLAASYEVVLDRRKAIGRAIQMAKTDDLILIAGKGHETYQEIKGKTYPFDDREIVKEFLNERV